MQISEMAANAVEEYNSNQNVSLILPRPWQQRPKGFPSGELLCEKQGLAVYSYEPIKLLKWLRKNELIEFKFHENVVSYILVPFVG
jgi:hypothetical protein